MAINRGALVAQTYQLPAAAPLQKPEPEAPYQDEIGDPAAGLQQIDGVTSEYFQKWAALKGFARDVQENLGVDVRYPDPSVPGSERLHRVYLKAIADLKAQGERLKTGQTMYMADRQRGALMTKDPSTQYYDEMNVGTDIVDTDLDPIVAEANKKLQGPHFGAAIKEAEAYHKTVRAMLEQRRNKDPKNAGYWQRQIDSLIEPVQAVREFDPRERNQWTPYQQGRIRGSASYLRKMANLKNGTAASFQLSDSIFGPNEERVYVSEDTKGDKFANGTVVRNEWIPETKQSFKVIKLPDGKTTKLDMTDVDEMTHAKGYLDNPRYAANGEYLDLAAEELGYFNEEGEVNLNNLLSKDAPSIYEKMLKQSADPKAMSVAASKEQLVAELEALQPGFFDDDSKVFKIKGGKEVEIEAEKGTTGTRIYKVLNADKIQPDPKKRATLLSMSLEQVRDFLLQNDAHLLLDDSGTKSAPKSNSKDPLGKVVPKVDPAAEAKRILELINSGK